jgi:hypothetical protein
MSGGRILRGVHQPLEDAADALIFGSLAGVTSRAEKSDILTPWKEKHRHTHEILSHILGLDLGHPEGDLRPVLQFGPAAFEQLHGSSHRPYRIARPDDSEPEEWTVLSPEMSHVVGAGAVADVDAELGRIVRIAPALHQPAAPVHRLRGLPHARDVIRCPRCRVAYRRVTDQDFMVVDRGPPRKELVAATGLDGGVQSGAHLPAHSRPGARSAITGARAYRGTDPVQHSYVSIAAWVSDLDVITIEGVEVRWPPLTTTQLSHHFNSNHCPVDARVLKELSEQRAQQLGVDYSELTGPFIDYLVYTKMIVAQGQQRLARGEIKPTMRDTLTAARLLADIETAAEERVTRTGCRPTPMPWSNTS